MEWNINGHGWTLASVGNPVAKTLVFKLSLPELKTRGVGGGGSYPISVPTLCFEKMAQIRKTAERSVNIEHTETFPSRRV